MLPLIMIFHQLVGRVMSWKNKSLLKDISDTKDSKQIAKNLSGGIEWLRLLIAIIWDHQFTLLLILSTQFRIIFWKMDMNSVNLWFKQNLGKKHLEIVRKDMQMSFSKLPALLRKNSLTIRLTVPKCFGHFKIPALFMIPFP